MVGSVVFDHGVGLENVGADLIAPADFFDFTADSGKLLGVFFLSEHIQLGFQHLHGLIFVLELGALVLALYHNSGRKMGDTDG